MRRSHASGRPWRARSARVQSTEVTLATAIAAASTTLTASRLRLRPRLIAARREMLDGRLAPDANGTLRVAFGQVRGYEPRDGVFYEPQTTIDGVLQKNTGVDPFDSPPRLLEMAKARRFGSYEDPDLGTLPVGFLSTVNVTNGSSGSSALTNTVTGWRRTRTSGRCSTRSAG